MSPTGPVNYSVRGVQYRNKARSGTTRAELGTETGSRDSASHQVGFNAAGNHPRGLLAVLQRAKLRSDLGDKKCRQFFPVPAVLVISACARYALLTSRTTPIDCPETGITPAQINFGAALAIRLHFFAPLILPLALLLSRLIAKGFGTIAKSVKEGNMKKP